MTIDTIAGTPQYNGLRSLEPVTVLGTGFLRQILAKPGSQQADLSDELRPLVDWGSLLREVAFAEKLFSAWDPSMTLRPTLQWDEMVRVKSGLIEATNNRKKPYQAEAELRKKVVEILKNAMSAAKPDGRKLSEFRAAAGRHIVSLNFDTLITGGEKAKPGKAPKSKEHQAPVYLESDQHTYWFPHGCTRRQNSIRLGLRDYGLLPSSWNNSFNHFKGYEQTWKDGRSWTDELFGKFQNDLVKHSGETPHTTLAGHLLLAPLIFFGTGLSESEWGWWWLMNQRARNLAGLPEARRPATVIIRSATDADASFWARRPAGITPIFVRNWDEGWEVLLRWLRHSKEHLNTPLSPDNGPHV